MPHLSPMNWIMTPIIFWLLLISVSTTLWWSQHLNFPEFMLISKNFNKKQWMW